MSFTSTSQRLTRHSIISPIERPLLRPTRISEEIRATVRGRSNEPLHRGLLSNKVPITWGKAGVTVHPIPLTSIGVEDKVSLYSEIERLTLLNLELKRQNESLLVEIDDHRAFIAKVPDMESAIHGLQREILQREQSFNDAIREHELLRADNANLLKLEPAYNELLSHNQDLILEVDNLEMRLKEILQERDLLEARAESAKVLRPKLDEAEKVIDALSQDLASKEQEVMDCVAKIEELSIRLNTFALENEQIHNYSLDHLKERDILAMRMEEMEKAHEMELADLKLRMETSHRAFLEHEKNQMGTKYLTEISKKEEELAQSLAIISDLETKLMVLADEVERLENTILNKAGEIDGLKMRINNLEEEKVELRRNGEIESTIMVEKQLAQQKLTYEETLSHMRKDLSELDRARISLKQKDNELEVLRAQLVSNDKLWEMKLQQAVSSEAKAASNKFLLELSALETEASISKDAVMKLENQLSVLTSEVERLTLLHNQKLIEINDLHRKLSSQEVSLKLALDEQRTKSELEKKASLEDLRRDIERVHFERVEEMRKLQVAMEEKILILIDENSRLSGIAEDRTRDVENFSVKLRVMEDIYKQNVDEIQKKSHVTQKAAVEKEVNSAAIRHMGERNDLESKVALYSTELERLKSQYYLQGADLERMIHSIKEKEVEIEQERRRYVELEIQRTKDINEIREQFDSYKRSNIDTNTLQVRFEAEKASLTSQIVQQREKAGELEKRLLMILGENEKMRSLNNERTSGVEILKLKYRDLEEKWLQEKRSLETELEILKRANLDGKEFSIKYVSEKAQYENQIKQLRTINENGKQELEKLYELMNQRKKDHDYYVKQNEELKKEVERMSRELREVGSESSLQRDKYQEYERNIRELERDRDLYKEHNERLNTQLQQTNFELQEKLREMDSVKRKYDDSITKLSTQLDKDLIKKLMGSPTMLSSSATKKERLNSSGFEF